MKHKKTKAGVGNKKMKNMDEFNTLALEDDVNEERIMAGIHSQINNSFKYQQQAAVTASKKIQPGSQ